MKKHLFFILFSLSLYSLGYAQNLKTDPIRVVLLGTFHYGVTTDASRTDFPDLFGSKRQSELEALTNRLAKLGVDKVFIERPAKYQDKYDSLYTLYRSQKLKDTVVLRPEEIQIGFRLAEKSKLDGVVCADVKLALPYDALQAFEAKQKDRKDAFFFTSNPNPFKDPSQKLNLADHTLIEYYLKANNTYHKKYRLYDYLHYAMSYKEDDDFTGAEFSGIWYERNLKIFSTILNNLTAKDKTIFVLFGSSHTDILEHFFESNPHFKIIPLDQVLVE